MTVKVIDHCFRWQSINSWYLLIYSSPWDNNKKDTQEKERCDTHSISCVCTAEVGLGSSLSVNILSCMQCIVIEPAYEDETLTKKSKKGIGRYISVWLLAVDCVCCMCL